MNNLLLALVLLGAGVAGGYFYSQSTVEPDVVIVAARIAEPREVQRLEVVEVVSQNTAVAIKKHTTAGRENNAAMLRQWQSVAQIGVDFTGFNWASVAGIGAELPETGQVLVKGVLPPLKVLNSFSKDEKDTVISRIAMILAGGYNEEAELGPLLDQQQKAVTDCIASQALNRLETIAIAQKTVKAMLGAAIPNRADGSSLVRFELTFANEDEIKAAVAAREQGSGECEATIFAD